LPQFFSELIGDLRDEVWRLRGDGNVSSGFEDRSGRDDMVLDLLNQLKQNNSELAAMKKKYKNVVFLFLVFVLGLVASKVLIQ
jgi:hypothetical protein